MDWNFGIYNPRKINANFQVPKEGLHRFILHRELQIRINWIRIQIRVQIQILSKYKKNMKLTSKPAFFYFNVCKKVLMFNDLCYNFDDSFLSKSGSGKCILILNTDFYVLYIKICCSPALVIRCKQKLYYKNKFNYWKNESY